MIECWSCEQTFEPNRCRWRCPYCGAKNSCCEGEPQREHYGQLRLFNTSKAHVLGSDWA